MNTHRFSKFISGDTLLLSRQNLTDDDVFDLVRFLYDHPAILKLDLSLNHIGDQGLADFSERNQTVLVVDFTGNNISDYGIALFAYKNRTILHADFSQNRISDKGITNYTLINDVCDHTKFSTIRYH